MARSTTVVSVTKRKPVEQKAKAPPAGSVWERIEAARKSKGWSERELSEKAGRTPAHYTGIKNRGNWATVQADVIADFVRALVEAGIPREELEPGGPPARVVLSHDSRDTLAMARKVVDLLMPLEDLTREQAWMVIAETRDYEPTPEGILAAATAQSRRMKARAAQADARVSDTSNLPSFEVRRERSGLASSPPLNQLGAEIKVASPERKEYGGEDQRRPRKI